MSRLNQSESYQCLGIVKPIRVAKPVRFLTAPRLHVKQFPFAMLTASRLEAIALSLLGLTRREQAKVSSMVPSPSKRRDGFHSVVPWST